jgi:glycosyltransferase involved in cell wall biosynthesis
MTRPLSVAVVARAVMPLHGVGGLERSVHDLVRHLAARGVNVTLIVPPAVHIHRPVIDDPFASPHIRIRHVRYLSFPFANRRGTTVLDRSTAYLLYGWRAGRLARSLANEGAVDVVHGFGASVLGASDGMMAPLVLNPQGLEEFGATGTLPALKQAGYAPLRWAVRHVAARAACIIATDVSLEPTVVRHLKPAAGQMRTIPNGIDLVAAGTLAGPADGLLTRRRHGIGPGEIIFLSVGRLEFNKGFDLMPAALAAAKSRGSTLAATGWRWVIVGGGPYRADVERQVAAHGLETHVTFTGRISERDLHAWYEAADVFVHPTRYEGSSLVTLEAMAHRLPVIATVAGGLPDKVHPGVNGWLVEPNDPEALSHAIAEAAANPTRLGGMGTRSREIVEHEFAWNVLAERYLNLYREMLTDRRI